MASDATLREAETIFAERLDVEQRVAARLIRLIESTYIAAIATAKRADLLEAARWAADRLQRRPGEDLAKASRSEIKTVLEDSGCPLCASSGDEKFYGTADGGEPQGGAQSQGSASA